MINKDTKLYGSFSSQAGSFGCLIHNHAFQELGINAIYKSFSVKSIKDAIFCMKTLGIKGAAVSMPYKELVLNYVDRQTEPVIEIGAANTIIDDGMLVAYNTDYLACKELISGTLSRDVVILGKGGFSKAAQYACKSLNRNFSLMTRTNWSPESLRNVIVFNATPLKHLEIDDTCIFIDCHTDTITGSRMAFISAREQFKLYTGLDFPDSLIEEYSI